MPAGTEERTEASLATCLAVLGESVRKSVQSVCSNMRKRFLNRIADRLNVAVHVMVRSPVMQISGNALRAWERELKKPEIPIGFRAAPVCCPESVPS